MEIWLLVLGSMNLALEKCTCGRAKHFLCCSSSYNNSNQTEVCKKIHNLDSQRTSVNKFIPTTKVAAIYFKKSVTGSSGKLESIKKKNSIKIQSLWKE
jgi:hypothetical protein